MSDDRETIVRMGDKLASTIQNITRDFQIGFGSFVDKEVMPFISMVPKGISFTSRHKSQDRDSILLSFHPDNCQLDSGCPQPYSFKHQMKLSPNAKLFTERVKTAPISGNIDNPEGGFDALLQVR